jgi:hypothetical protein
MNVTERSRIKTILRRFPTAEDAFGWYGIELDGFDADTTVDDVAREFRMDVYDLVGDIQAHIDDEKRDRDPDEDYGDDGDDDDDDDDYYDDDEDDDDDDDATGKTSTGWNSNSNDDDEFDG